MKFLELPHRAAAESIAAGRVDAANIAPPVLTEAVQSGKCQIIGHAQDAIAKHFITTAYFCMSDFAQKNADVMARFRRGLYEAAAYANTHFSELVPVLAKYTGFDEKTIAAMVTTPIAQSPKQLDARMIQPIIDASYKYKARRATSRPRTSSTPTPSPDQLAASVLAGGGDGRCGTVVLVELRRDAGFAHLFEPERVHARILVFVFDLIAAELHADRHLVAQAVFRGGRTRLRLDERVAGVAARNDRQIA